MVHPLVERNVVTEPFLYADFEWWRMYVVEGNLRQETFSVSAQIPLTDISDIDILFRNKPSTDFPILIRVAPLSPIPNLRETRSFLIFENNEVFTKFVSHKVNYPVHILLKKDFLHWVRYRFDNTELKIQVSAKVSVVKAELNYPKTFSRKDTWAKAATYGVPDKVSVSGKSSAASPTTAGSDCRKSRLLGEHSQSKGEDVEKSMHTKVSVTESHYDASVVANVRKTVNTAKSEPCKVVADNGNPGDDVMGMPVPAIVSVAESVLSTVGDNVDKTASSPDPSHNKDKIAPVVSVAETHDANVNDGVIKLASSEESDNKEDVAAAERERFTQKLLQKLYLFLQMKLRYKFNIPDEGLITDKCLNFLDKHYYFLDGATQVMHPTAAMIIGRSSYLKFPKIAEEWYMKGGSGTAGMPTNEEIRTSFRREDHPGWDQFLVEINLLPGTMPDHVPDDQLHAIYWMFSAAKTWSSATLNDVLTTISEIL